MSIKWWRRKKNKLQSKDLDIFLRQSKRSYYNQCGNVKIFYVYKEVFWFVYNYYKIKKKNRKNIKIIHEEFEGDDYAFMVGEGTSMASISK